MSIWDYNEIEIKLECLNECLSAYQCLHEIKHKCLHIKRECLHKIPYLTNSSQKLQIQYVTHHDILCPNEALRHSWKT